MNKRDQRNKKNIQVQPHKLIIKIRLQPILPDFKVDLSLIDLAKSHILEPLCVRMNSTKRQNIGQIRE